MYNTYANTHIRFLFLSLSVHHPFFLFTFLSSTILCSFLLLSFPFLSFPFLPFPFLSFPFLSRPLMFLFPFFKEENTCLPSHKSSEQILSHYFSSFFILFFPDKFAKKDAATPLFLSF